MSNIVTGLGLTSALPERVPEQQRKKEMYFLTWQFWLTAAVASASILSSPLAAQTTEKGPVRTVLALGRVATMIETPMYFKLSRVTIPAAATVVYRGAHSMIYLLSGALIV